MLMTTYGSWGCAFSPCLQALGPAVFSPLQLWAMLFPLSFIIAPLLTGEVQCSVWIQGLRQVGFFVFTVSPTICAPLFVIFDTCHTVHISLVPFPPKGSSLGPHVMWRCSGTQSWATLRLKMRRDGQSVMLYQSDQTELSPLLLNLGKLNCLVTYVTEMIYQ